MRLIDADALIETMKRVETEYEDAMTCPSWWTAYSVISEQPTAYDVEKVITELEELKSKLEELHDYNEDYLGRYELACRCLQLSTDIEVVKRGGVK